jgi:hypothetical protein
VVGLLEQRLTALAEELEAMAEVLGEAQADIDAKACPRPAPTGPGPAASPLLAVAQDVELAELRAGGGGGGRVGQIPVVVGAAARRAPKAPVRPRVALAMARALMPASSSTISRSPPATPQSQQVAAPPELTPRTEAEMAEAVAVQMELEDDGLDSDATNDDGSGTAIGTLLARAPAPALAPASASLPAPAQSRSAGQLSADPEALAGFLRRFAARGNALQENELAEALATLPRSDAAVAKRGRLLRTFALWEAGGRYEVRCWQRLRGSWGSRAGRAGLDLAARPGGLRGFRAVRRARTARAAGAAAALRRGDQGQRRAPAEARPPDRARGAAVWPRPARLCTREPR